MKKIIPLLIWLALIVSACTTPASLSTPVPITATATHRQDTPTPSPTSTPTETPTPTPVPKTPEQLAAEDAVAAFAAGAHLRDYEGWAEVQPATKYYAFYKHSADPERVTDEDLAQLDTFVHEMRRLTFEEAVNLNFEAAKRALVEGSKNAMYPGTQPPEAITAMDQIGLLEYYESLNLTPHGRRLTDEVLALLTGRDQFITPNEVMEMEHDPDGLVLFASNVSERMLVTGSGYYGFFQRDSYEYINKGPEYAPLINTTYTIPMFGRDTVRTGIHSKNDPFMADYIGRFPLPHTSQNGLWGVLLWMKTPEGEIYEHAVAAATRPFDLPARSPVFGLFGTNENINRYSGELQDSIQVESRIAVDKDAFSEFITLLTPEKLQTWAGWPPYYVKTYTGYFTDRYKKTTTVFDPETGLIIISNKVGDRSLGYNGYLFFGTDGHNPWP